MTQTALRQLGLAGMYLKTVDERLPPPTPTGGPTGIADQTREAIRSPVTKSGFNRTWNGVSAIVSQFLNGEPVPIEAVNAALETLKDIGGSLIATAITIQVIIECNPGELRKVVMPAGRGVSLRRVWPDPPDRGRGPA